MNPSVIDEVSWMSFLENTYMLSLPSFIIMFCYMIKKEGTRLTIVLIVPGKILLEFSRYTEYWYSFSSLITVIIITILTMVYYFYPVYYFTESTGRDRVGYRNFKIIKEIVTQVSVFYPTHSLKSDYKEALWMPSGFIKDLYKIGRNAYG